MPENKIAIVTGGSRGLGKDMALRLAEKGTDVIITWHTQNEAALAVVKQIESLGSKAAALQLDVEKFEYRYFYKGLCTHVINKLNK